MADTAEKAFEEKRYVESVKLFNVFMKDHPKQTTPDHFLLRSTALLRLGKKEAALRDADRGTRLAALKKNKEALAKAQMRRAVTYVSLGDNAAAKKCVDFAEEANPEERSLPVWKAKIGMSSGANDPSDVVQIPDIDISYIWKGSAGKVESKDEAKAIEMTEVKPDIKPKADVKPVSKTETSAKNESISKTAKADSKTPAKSETNPTFKVPTSDFDFEPKTEVKSKAEDKSVVKETSSTKDTVEETSSVKPEVKTSSSTVSEDLRTDFFQSNDKITVSVYRKNTPKDAKCDIKPTHISIESPEYSWSTQLYAPVDPSQSSVQIYGTKVDFTLVKKNAGKWPTASGNASESDGNKTVSDSAASPIPAGNNSGSGAQITNIDFFQTPTHINAYLYMPNLVNYTPKVSGTSGSFKVTFTNTSNPQDSFDKTVILHGDIEPELLQEKVYPTKLEIQMRKKTSGNWPSLEKGASGASSASSAMAAPTTKDWSKIQIEDDSDDELNSENPDDFFKALYADADDDTRRAMMKSFVESGGTSLSTDWDKVEKGEHN
ncbi:Protein SGT1 [Yarrowia sp. E02]|nr:Protein SGT1 [Yarrowia sp. E02]